MRETSMMRTKVREPGTLSPLCWWCGGRLVGPGGVAGKEPLSFKLITPPYASMSVKVHVACEKDAIAGEDFHEFK
jgi:hypothetical protein